MEQQTIILYSTDCPLCAVLKQQLIEKQIVYTEINDIKTMLSLGMTTVPNLQIDDKILNYREALEWLRGGDNNGL